MEPPIETWAALEKVLKDDLGYCTCGEPDTLPFLRDFLRLVAERTDAMSDPDPDHKRYRRAPQALTEFLDANGSGGIRNWFVYGADRAGLRTAQL